MDHSLSPRASPGRVSSSARQPPILEFAEEFEIGPNAGQRFAALGHIGGVELALPGTELQILHTRRIDAHDAAAGGVESHHVAASGNYSRELARALDGTIALHADDAVHQAKVLRERIVQIGNALRIPAQ